MELKHTTKQLGEKEGQKSNSDSSYQRNKMQLDAKTAAIQKLNVIA